MLDRIIASKRTELGLADDSLQGVAVEFAEIEPWPKAVGGAQVLDEIANALRRHVVLSDDARDACALWIAHTHLIERFRISPKLSLRSPTRNCGKSTLLEVIAPMVRRPLLASNITPAALFRVVQKHRPTLLIDEVDSFLRDNDEVRGLLNASHRHDGQIIRTVGDDHEPRAFRVYAAVALSGIGALPPTVADRSIDIELKRRLRGEALEELRAGATAHLDEIARRLARWVTDNADRVAAVRPQMPDGLVNRLADNWAPLLAIADVVGGDWPKRARKAAAKAATNVDASEENRIELALADIRTVFDQEAEASGRPPDGDDRIASDDLVERMVAIEGRPWAEYSRSGKPMTKNALARLLDKIYVSPQVVRIEDRTPRGYCRRQFEEAWDRYLSHQGFSNRNTATNPGKPGQSGQFATATKEMPVAVSNPRSSADNAGLLRCCGCEEGDGAAPICAQCHGPPDGKEQLVAIGDETVPLHPECVRFFVKRRGEA